MASPTAPTISETGIYAPTFSDIFAYLQEQYRSIFGADIYLGSDSQDGQFLGIVAAAINDSNAAAVSCYNAFSPATAQGNGLSSVVKINGIRRQSASSSTANVEIIGQAGTTITNGMVSDANGNKWALPASVVVPTSGTITVTVTCTEQGAIEAPANTITKISTPSYGWQTVNNPSAAAPGSPLEKDAALRIRQDISVALPSLTVLEGIVAAVLAVPGVTQVVPYENDTNTTDAKGIPPHAIAIVARGGDATEIATAIAAKKTPGAYTHGSTTIYVTDKIGISYPIRFSTPTLVPISVAITLHSLTGYTTAIADKIKQSVVDYINALLIGQSVLLPRLYVPAQLSGGEGSSTFEIASLLIAKTPGTPAASDVAILFSELATCSISDVSVTVV